MTADETKRVREAANDVLIMALAERVAGQAELLSRRSERKESSMGGICKHGATIFECSQCRLAAVEEKLRESEARHHGLRQAVRWLLDNSPCGLADPDDDARYQRAKAKVKKLLNCS